MTIECELIGMLDLKGWHAQYCRVYSDMGVAPSVVCLTGGGRETKVLEVYHV